MRARPPLLLRRRALLASLGALAARPLGAQGFAGMGSQAASGFAQPAPPPRFRFPRDHGPHPEFRIEWWYLTANLEDETGAPCGIQWTLFRSALAPGEAPGWASPQIWFAHAAMTRADAHIASERMARGGIGQAGVTAAPFAAWIDDWALESQATPEADPLSALSLKATGPAAFDLRLQAQGPLIFHGDQGYSLKHPSGLASYYYSQPFYELTGVLHWPDGPRQVRGRAWLDREWSSQPLGPTQAGWDWFALHFASGEKAMIARLRDRSGGGHHAATWIDPDGHSAALGPEGIQMTPLAQTRLQAATLPTRWRLNLPARGLDIEVEALNPKAWMGLNIGYWEGPVRARGSHPGQGYLEMTGYDRA